MINKRTTIINNLTSSMTPNKNRPLIVFGEDWGAHPSSTQHIVKVLGQTRPIIWLNSIGLRKPKLTLQDLVRAFHKVSSFIVNQTTTNEEEENNTNACNKTNNTNANNN